MSVNFKTLLSVVEHVVNVRKPIMLRGGHGKGKSQVVYQIAENLGLPVIERRISQMSEGDLMGLPVVDGNRTSFNPPDWYKDACEFACVLFLDELDRGTIEVRQGVFELGDSRKLNGHNLHPDTIIIAAVNGGIHGAQYQVGEMDPAELDRWTVFDVEPDIEDWLAWGADNVAPMVWDFINNNRNHLEHGTDFEPNKVYPSRRSWHRLSDCLMQAQFLEEPEQSLSEIYVLSEAFVGFEAAVAFQEFCKNYKCVVTPNDIINLGKIDSTESFGINDHSALIEKMEAEKIFETKLEDSQIENLAKYFVALPSEIAMKLWTVMGDGELENTVKLHQSKVGDKAISSVFVEILTGKDAIKNDV